MAEKIPTLQPYEMVWIRKDLFIRSALVDPIKTLKVTFFLLSFSSYIARLGGCGGSVGKSENDKYFKSIHRIIEISLQWDNI